MQTYYSETEYNKIIAAYEPYAVRLANAEWNKVFGDERMCDTQKRNTDIVTKQDVIMAAKEGLVMGKKKWNPLLAGCKHKCVLRTPEDKCEHGERGYTYGAYAKQWIFGEIRRVIESGFRKKTHLFPDELMPLSGGDSEVNERADARADEQDRYPDHELLADGSNYDGAPCSERWSAHDRSILMKKILSARIIVHGLKREQVLNIIRDLGLGYTHGEIAENHKVKVRHVLAVIAALRNALQHTEFAKEEQAQEQTLYSLPEAIDMVLEKTVSAEATEAERKKHRQVIERKINQWFARGGIIGARTTGGRCLLSKYAVKSCIDKIKG